MLAALQDAIAPLLPTAPAPRLAKLRPGTLRTLLLTLLFLVMVGLERPWDLRTYTGTMLALLTGRSCTYGYGMVDRFLAQLAQTAAPAALTTMLAQWATRLWHPDRLGYLLPGPLYLDGHKKPVYSDVLVPRGRIGRTGKILGCRTLTVLHDAAGHPLAVTTARGDAHLTTTIPPLLQQYETASGSFPRLLIMDREGMSGDFLAALVAQQHGVVTLLRRDQYAGLASFTDIGPFVPIQVTSDGQVLRAVARARYRLTVPSQPDQPLLLNCALIHDYRGLTAAARRAEPRLIPVVTTGALARPETLVAWYTGRWPAQENHFKLWLLPLGLDVNAGFAKTAVPNSEAAKRRARGERQAVRLQTQAVTASATLAQRQAAATAAQRTATSAAELVPVVRAADRVLAQQHADALQAAVAAADDRVTATAAKLERLHHAAQTVAQRQAELAQAPSMYELDNRKDQVMTVLKCCAANLGMWTRDQFFGADYAQAGWGRLRPFFALAGQIRVEAERTVVTLAGFNDRQRNRDLDSVCQRVRERQPKLPDGTTLVFERMERGDVSLDTV